MLLDMHNLLFSLSYALDYVERELLGVTTNHSKRVALICTRTAKHMGFTDTEIFDLASCAVLHDNGLTEYTLNKGRQDSAMQHDLGFHCTCGEKNALDFPFQGDARRVILHHHENWDGSGAFGLRGGEISLRAAVLRLADNTDLQLRMNMGARKSLHVKTLKHVRANRGLLYAPEVSDAFLDICDPAFMDMVRDENVETALAECMPPVAVRLSLPSLLQVCGIFSGITDAKSPFTCQHSRGVAQKIARMSAHYGLSEEQSLKMQAAAHLHDIGKLMIPAAILEKPDKLSDGELAVMRRHVQGTTDILASVRGLEEVATWAAMHHEKLNGSGYPRGLHGDALPFESRLIASLDIYQALVEDRPYRAGMHHDAAMTIMQGMADRGELDTSIQNAMREALREETPPAPTA